MPPAARTGMSTDSTTLGTRIRVETLSLWGNPPLLESGHCDGVVAYLLGVDGVLHGAHLVEDLHARLLCHGEVLGPQEAVHRGPGDLHGRHLLFAADPEEILQELHGEADGGHGGDVHDEGPLRELPGPVDRLPELVARVVVARSEVPHGPGVADGRGELGRGQPEHAAALDGVLDSEELRDFRLHSFFSLDPIFSCFLLDNEGVSEYHLPP